MFLPPLQLPLISAGFFAAFIARMLDFVSLRVRRSDQGMTPSLSPGLRAQTVALHRRLTVLTGEFHRLAKLAREGRLRVYPERPAPAGGSLISRLRSRAVRDARTLPASPFGPGGVAQGPVLPPLPTSGFGWMLGFVPAGYRDPLPGLLRNPEMVALIGAAPSVARLLRSLCHGLGVERPEGVFPARQRHGARATPRSRDGARTDTNGGAEVLPDQAVPASAARPRAPAIAMSAKARERWWRAHRSASCSAGGAMEAAVRDAPVPGRCAKS